MGGFVTMACNRLKEGDRRLSFGSDCPTDTTFSFDALTPCSLADLLNDAVPCDFSEADLDEEIDTQDDIRLMKLGAFKEFLEKNSVPVVKYGSNKAKTLRDLWVDVVLGCTKLHRCTFNPTPPNVSPTLCLEMRLVMLELCVNIDGNDMCLLVRDEFPESNWGVSRQELRAPVTANMFSGESLFEALSRLCVQKLGLADDICLQQVLIEKCSYSEDVQRTSSVFPGVVTIYKIHRLVVHFQDVCDPGLACIGLPHGNEFDATCEGSMGNSCTNFFVWVSREEFDEAVVRWYGDDGALGSTTSPKRSHMYFDVQFSEKNDASTEQD